MGNILAIGYIDFVVKGKDRQADKEVSGEEHVLGGAFCRAVFEGGTV